MPQKRKKPGVSLGSLLGPAVEGTKDGLEDILIDGINFDSREILPGDLFIAIHGGSVDGHQFIPDAVDNGAVAVVGTRDIGELSVPYFIVDDTRLALAEISAGFYGHPSRNLIVIGVTGTDGKTTTASLIYHILAAANIKTGMISTVSARIGEKDLDTGFHVTTPQAPEIQYYLASMVEEGLTHVVIEMTSHGLDQHRVSAVDVNIGVITNITHEHLDYHGTYDAYIEAKSRLFQLITAASSVLNTSPRYSVLNRDDNSFEYLSSRIDIPVTTYGCSEEADVRAEDISVREDAVSFMAVGHRRTGVVAALEPFRQHIECHLPGLYNVHNCLAAITATARCLGIDSNVVSNGIAALKVIPGRMERIDLGQDFLAYVDFAHTPNALMNALNAARTILNQEGRSGRLITIFGSAGLRDKDKRKMMAEISAEHADVTILTAEDPRTESLDTILSEMEAGVLVYGGKLGQTYFIIKDRGAAIQKAVSIANPDDLVVVCGKGHEQSMCFGEVEYPWDDRIALRAALAGLLGRDGPSMPYLPTQENSDS